VAGLEVKGARVESQVGRVGKVWKRVSSFGPLDCL
jgi:hypothetical protein